MDMDEVCADEYAQQRKPIGGMCWECRHSLELPRESVGPSRGLRVGIVCGLRPKPAAGWFTPNPARCPHHKP